MGAWKDATVSISRYAPIDTVAHVAFIDQRRCYNASNGAGLHHVGAPRPVRVFCVTGEAQHTHPTRGKNLFPRPQRDPERRKKSLKVKEFREVMQNELCDFEQKKLLRSLENQPITGRIEISRLHQKVFADWKKTFSGQQFLREDPAAYNYFALVAAIKLYNKNMRERDQQADELVLQIKEERRIERLKYKEKTPISVRLKGIHAELIDLRRQGLSWTQISTYLYRRHRKYFGARKLSPDYIRRVFLKLEKERAS